MPDPGDADGDVGAAAVAVEHDAGGSSGLLRAALDGGERREQHDARREERERRPRAPAVGLGERETVDEREQAEHRGQRARHVDARPRGTRLARQQSERAERRRDREGEVHVQAPAPGEVLGQHAAEDEADGSAAAGDGAEDPERLSALGGVGEGGVQQRQGGGGEQRAEGALQCPRAREQAEALSGASERRCDGETDQPGDQGRPAAEDVADPPADQEQAAECDGVRRDDPLAVVVGEVQRLLRRRQSDAHDRRVEHDHELRDGDEGEDPPAPCVLAVGAGRPCDLGGVVHPTMVGRRPSRVVGAPWIPAVPPGAYGRRAVSRRRGARRARRPPRRGRPPRRRGPAPPAVACRRCSVESPMSASWA